MPDETTLSPALPAGQDLAGAGDLAPDRRSLCDPEPQTGFSGTFPAQCPHPQLLPAFSGTPGGGAAGEHVPAP